MQQHFNIVSKRPPLNYQKKCAIQQAFKTKFKETLFYVFFAIYIQKQLQNLLA